MHIKSPDSLEIKNAMILVKQVFHKHGIHNGLGLFWVANIFHVMKVHLCGKNYSRNPLLISQSNLKNTLSLKGAACRKKIIWGVTLILIVALMIIRRRVVSGVGWDI